MRFRAPQGRYRSLPGVLIALAAVICAGSSRAEAGCSHYVFAGRDGGGPSPRLEILDLDSAASSVPVAAQTPARPKPCSGAFCTGKPAIPAPVPAASAPSRVEQWGELMAPLPPISTVGRTWIDRECFVHAVVEGPSIERPPRFSRPTLS